MSRHLGHVLAVSVVLSVWVAGCGGGSTPVAPGPPTPSTPVTPTAPIVASGENWSFRFDGLTGVGLTSGYGNTVALGALEGSFDAAGSSVTAVMQPFGRCYRGDTLRLYFTGTRSGSEVVIQTQLATGDLIVITATLSASRNTLQGTYSIAGGCGSGTRGTIAGQRVDLSGVWRGTLGRLPVAIDLAMAAAPDADGPNYVLSGPVTFSDTQCFLTAEITRRARGRVLFPDIVGPTQRLELIAEVDDTLSTMHITSVLVSGTCPELSFTDGRLVRQ